MVYGMTEYDIVQLRVAAQCKMQCSVVVMLGAMLVDGMGYNNLLFEFLQRPSI